MTTEMPRSIEVKTTQNIELHRGLDRARSAMRGPRAARLLSPRMFYSKVLELRAKRSQCAIHVEARTFWGVPMMVAFPDQVSMMIYRYGLFEEDVASIFLARIQPGGLVLDIGAHLGFFSLLASRLAGAEGQVHSFEPTPSTYALLRQNLSKVKNAHAQNAAAYSHDTTISFRDFGIAFPAFNSMYSGRLDDDARLQAKTTTYEVTAIALDGFAQRLGLHPTFVKMDAEGAEFDILQGMQRILEHDRPDLVLEVGDKGDSAGASSQKIIDHLRALRYRAFEHVNRHFIEHTPNERFSHKNLLFIAEEKCGDRGWVPSALIGESSIHQNSER